MSFKFIDSEIVINKCISYLDKKENQRVQAYNNVIKSHLNMTVGILWWKKTLKTEEEVINHVKSIDPFEFWLSVDGITENENCIKIKKLLKLSRQNPNDQILVSSDEWNIIN